MAPSPQAQGEGREVLLLDLAGLAQPDDVVTAAADAAARRELAACDILLLVVDIARPQMEIMEHVRSLRPAATTVLLANKADTLPDDQVRRAAAGLAQTTNLTVLPTSALTGSGLHEVRNYLSRMLHLEVQRSSPSCALHRRQRAALEQAAAALDRAADLAAPLGQLGERAEIIAVELRSALAELGTISGDVVTEELLGIIFERFCVGK